jgi:hypothetical protein
MDAFGRNAMPRPFTEGPRKYGASQGYTRMQSLRILRTAEVKVKKLLLAGVAALSVLSASAAHADPCQPLTPLGFRLPLLG